MFFSRDDTTHRMTVSTLDSVHMSIARSFNVGFIQESKFKKKKTRNNETLHMHEGKMSKQKKRSRNSEFELNFLISYPRFSQEVLQPPE